MTTANNDNSNTEPQKEGHCKTECCTKGSCGMKILSPCGLLKIGILVILIAYAVNYFMK